MFKYTYLDLMNGKVVALPWNKLVEILQNLSERKINTISIQQGIDGLYYCKVDNATKIMHEESQI